MAPGCDVDPVVGQLSELANQVRQPRAGAGGALGRPTEPVQNHQVAQFVQQSEAKEVRLWHVVVSGEKQVSATHNVTVRRDRGPSIYLYITVVLII